MIKKILVKVIAHPNSRMSKVKKNESGCLDIYVNKPAIEGKVNQEIIVLLSDFFNVKKNQVFLVSGEKSKNKFFEIIN